MVEGAARVIKVKHLVSIQVLVHGKGLLEFLGHVDALVLFEVLRVECLGQEVSKSHYSTGLIFTVHVHVELDFAAELSAPEHREDAADSLLVKDLLRLVIEFVVWHVDLVVSQHSVENHDCSFEINSINELIAVA